MISTIRATPGHALMSERDTLAAIAEHLALAFAPLREATADLDSFVDGHQLDDNGHIMLRY